MYDPLFNEKQSLIPTSVKFKYNTTDKHLIATGYTNFFTKFSVSLNNLVCTYISKLIMVVIIIIIIIIVVIITNIAVTIILWSLSYYHQFCYWLLPGKQYHHKIWDQYNHRPIHELKLLAFDFSSFFFFFIITWSRYETNKCSHSSSVCNC